MQWMSFLFCGAALSGAAVIAWMGNSRPSSVDAGTRIEGGEYRVLEPLQSGALTLFPVVPREMTPRGSQWDFLTLDEGLRSGEVEVTEAGRMEGMVRPRRGHPHPAESYRGDSVNTLALVNNSDRPLLLLAGEIVTGGKQDRVIAKDRVVPAHSDPIDLSVFCIEPGRWVATSSKFGASADDNRQSFMVQPSVRSKAMVKEDQQQVWSSVAGTVSGVAGAAPMAGPVGSSSYAKAMANPSIAQEVDKAAGSLIRSKDEILKRLREEHAVGVVVAVHGEIIWADLFASPRMLEAYWTKLVRSYAAESFDNMRKGHELATREFVAQFLNNPPHGRETSEGETGVYRYREVRGANQSAFYLQVLSESGDFYAHISRVVEEGSDGRVQPVYVR